MKEFEQEDVYITIEELELRSRTYAVLKRGGINSINELLEISLHALSEFRNMGRKDLQLIMEALVPSWTGSIHPLLSNDTKRQTSLKNLIETFEK